MFAIRRRALPGTRAALAFTALVLTAGVMTAPAAYAAPTTTKMVCATLDQTTTELGPTNASLYLPKFDPALGTLLSVDITEVELEVISSTTLTNTASNTSRFKFSSVLDWTLSLPGGDVIGDQVQLLSTGLVLVSLAPGASLPLGPTDALSPLTVPSITGAAMADYVGAGATFVTGFNTFTTTAFIGGGGNIANPQQTTAGGKICVIYTYEPVSYTHLTLPTNREV